jgi:hypothetical protein
VLQTDFRGQFGPIRIKNRCFLHGLEGPRPTLAPMKLRHCLIPHLVEGGVSVLQYADDTIIFLEHDLEKALNMKLILCIFEQLSGLNINFHKSELFCFGKAEDQYKHLFGCQSGMLPIKYSLGPKM